MPLMYMCICVSYNFNAPPYLRLNALALEGPPCACASHEASLAFATLSRCDLPAGCRRQNRSYCAFDPKGRWPRSAREAELCK